jgi:GTPase SAR1 family protein
MGCFIPTTAPVGPKNDIDLQLENAKEEEKYNHKILLLGAGESGKSTVVKQIKLIWKVGGGLSEREKTEYITAIRRNVIEAMQTLLEAAKKLNIPIETEGLNGDEILKLETSATLTIPLAHKIAALWADPGIKKAYSRRDEYWILDATPYYLDEVFRLADPDFDPTEDDVIMTRVRTTGIVVTVVPEPPYTYHVVDVGGQRSERRKWIHCFDDVRAIIFLEGLSGYNQGYI